MVSPAEIPSADEALKSLITEFRSTPSIAFPALASALLARGHADDALRVADHGLALVPDSVEGRLARAEANLALDRPRVAYVELRRALAIDPTNRRVLRLLGRAYKDGGAPERAAELLKGRRKGVDASLWETSTTNASPTADTNASTATNDPTAHPRNDVLSSLTSDLGLPAAPRRASSQRVEVTQVIRRKDIDPAARADGELQAIEGPIVDTAQVTRAHETTTDLPTGPATAHDAAAPFFLSNLVLDHLADEPLFEENPLFAVRSVGPEEALSYGARTTDSGDKGHEDGSSDSRATPVRETTARSRLATEIRRPAAIQGANDAPPSEPNSTEAPPVFLERASVPTPFARQLAAFAAGLLVVLLFAAALVWVAQDRMRPWLMSEGSEPSKQP